MITLGVGLFALIAGSVLGYAFRGKEAKLLKEGLADSEAELAKVKADLAAVLKKV